MNVSIKFILKYGCAIGKKVLWNLLRSIVFENMEKRNKDGGRPRQEVATLKGDYVEGRLT